MKDIIDALGGSGEVHKQLKLPQSTVSMWRRRGIPWRWRNNIAKLAALRGVRLPKNFLDGKAA